MSGSDERRANDGEPATRRDPNPYQVPPSGEGDVDADHRSGFPTPRPLTPGEAEDLRRRQLRLVMRLALLSAATTVAACTAFVVVGLEPVTSAVVIALVLGFGFTIAWKV